MLRCSAYIMNTQSRLQKENRYVNWIWQMTQKWNIIGDSKSPVASVNFDTIFDKTTVTWNGSLIDVHIICHKRFGKSIETLPIIVTCLKLQHFFQMIRLSLKNRSLLFTVWYFFVVIELVLVLVLIYLQGILCITSWAYIIIWTV